ncbi:hypothetical protein BC343_19135 [Mucilaginibacter pedocola]|uniref:Uncharacterized protein n=1 Tax=Mucilaginibacter pedocola TaxID=1792845 RepID=A0A1S9P6I0_9SPHI|nr:hypothetical protein BC343_19135 [Mucilaginibacter pedocola]
MKNKIYQRLITRGTSGALLLMGKFYKHDTPNGVQISLQTPEGYRVCSKESGVFWLRRCRLFSEQEIEGQLTLSA